MFITQTITSNAQSSWFGFAFVLDNELKGKRLEIVEALSKANIESRPIVAGNFVKNPVIKYMRTRISDTLDSANHIDENGLFIGNNQGNISEQIKYFAETFDKIIEEILSKS